MLRRPASTRARASGLRRRKLTFPWTWVVVVLLLVPTNALRAQDVDARHEAPVLLKLLTYDRQLTRRGEGPIRIGILHAQGSTAGRDRARSLADAFESLSAKTIEGRTFEYEVIAWSPSDPRRDVDVVYVGASLRDQQDSIREHTRAEGILTLAATEKQVRDGLSVALTIERGRPVIVVNLDAVASEGHDLDARILRICRVLGGER